MWIMLNSAFISVVSPRKGSPAAKADQLVCRARVKGHLELAFGEWATAIQEDAGTDYRYRCLVRRDIVAKVIADHVRSIDYGNFKDSVANKPYHDALMGVWTIMHRLQERFRPPVRRRQRNFTAPGFDVDDLDWNPGQRHHR